MREFARARVALWRRIYQTYLFWSASNLFRLIRLQKTEEEIERMRAAALLNEQAVVAFHQEMAVGRTECEVASHYYRTVARGRRQMELVSFGGREAFGLHFSAL